MHTMRLMHLPFRCAIALIGTITVLSAALSPARAEDELNLPLPSTLPDAYKNVGVIEHLNSTIPLSLTFVDEHGRSVNLGEYFKPDRPVVLQMGYFACPMLCDTISRELLDKTRDIDLKAGSDYEFIFVSIDPSETPDSAAIKKQNFMREYGKSDEKDGFHFLVGRSKAVIDRLTDAVGFQYQRVDNGQYAHPAVLAILTPEGKLSRYLNGLSFPAQTLRLSLVDASNGKIGTVLDEFLSVCLQYDSRTGKYAWRAMLLMRFVGGLTILLVGGTLFWLFRHTGPNHVGQGPMDAQAPAGMSRAPDEDPSR